MRDVSGLNSSYALNANASGIATTNVCSATWVGVAPCFLIG